MNQEMRRRTNQKAKMWRNRIENFQCGCIPNRLISLLPCRTLQYLSLLPQFFLVIFNLESILDRAPSGYTFLVSYYRDEDRVNSRILWEIVLSNFPPVNVCPWLCVFQLPLSRSGYIFDNIYLVCRKHSLKHSSPLPFGIAKANMPQDSLQLQSSRARRKMAAFLGVLTRLVVFSRSADINSLP